MKKITTAIAFALTVLASSAQTNSLFLRRDTVVLKAQECNWLIPSGEKSNGGNAMNNVSEWFIQSIQKGKLKAVDPDSDQVIPARKILTWNGAADTVAVVDENGETTKYQVVQTEINPSRISRIRILQDWYLDRASGKLFSRVTWVELMLEVEGPSGLFMGFKPYCRVYYN